jgi:hypothetical protein
MRIPLPTDLSSRDGTTAKDARQLNAFIDGENVVKRPAVNSVLATSTGQAQGGIVNVNSLVYVVNGDVMKSYNAAFALQETITL